MQTPVERIRAICRNKGITIHRLEMDLNFRNGYLNPKKTKEIPSGKLLAIAEYLGVSVSELLEEKENPAPNSTGLPQEFIDMFNRMSAQNKADLDKFARFLLSQEADK